MIYGREASAFTRIETRVVGKGPLEHVEAHLSLDGLPPALDGLRIGHITDLHFGAKAPCLDDLLAWVQGAHPDLWAVTGDLYESRRGEAALRKLIGALSAPLGVYLVTGNNDHRVFARSGGPAGPMRELGARVLLNEHVVLERGGVEFAVVGVDDSSRHRDDLARALDGVRTDATFTLLLAHSPDVAFTAAEAGVSLAIVGHTHGGQIRFPGIGALTARLRTRGCGRRMAAGPFQVARTVYYVSRGIGCSLLPIRILCPPEVTTFILHPSEAS